MFYDELMTVLNSHKKEQEKQRTELYSQLILIDRTTPKWKSEALLYSVVSSIYNDAIYQYRADWLGMQSIDIYIPSLSIGIEYQGVQHYKPIEHFGGKEHFIQQQKNDEKKRNLCKQNGVKLIEWSYDQEINETNLIECIEGCKSIENSSQPNNNYLEPAKLTNTKKAKKSKPVTNKTNAICIWPVDKKVEVVNKNIIDKIPVKVLSIEYKISVSSISGWIAAYKRYGKSGLVDRRYKNKEKDI